MKIVINDQRKIVAIKEEFNRMFPFLRLEFLSKPHQHGGAPSDKFVKHNSQTLGECRTVHAKGHISISHDITVSALEQNFRDVYGLGVKVFRKCGNLWLETSVTEGWTLEEQNRHGQSLSSPEKKDHDTDKDQK